MSLKFKGASGVVRNMAAVLIISLGRILNPQTAPNGSSVSVSMMW